MEETDRLIDLNDEKEETTEDDVIDDCTNNNVINTGFNNDAKENAINNNVANNANNNNVKDAINDVIKHAIDNVKKFATNNNNVTEDSTNNAIKEVSNINNAEEDDTNNNANEDAANYATNANEDTTNNATNANEDAGNNATNAHSKVLDKNTNDRDNKPILRPSQTRRQTRQGTSGCLCACINFIFLVCCGVIAIDVLVYVGLKDLRHNVDVMKKRPTDEMDMAMIKTQLEYIENMLEKETTTPFKLRQHDFPLRNSIENQTTIPVADSLVADLQTSQIPQTPQTPQTPQSVTGSPHLDSIIQRITDILSEDGLNKQLRSIEAKVDRAVMKEKQMASEEKILVGILSEMKTKVESIEAKQRKTKSTAR